MRGSSRRRARVIRGLVPNDVLIFNVSKQQKKIMELTYQVCWTLPGDSRPYWSFAEYLEKAIELIVLKAARPTVDLQNQTLNEQLMRMGDRVRITGMPYSERVCAIKGSSNVIVTVMPIFKLDG